MKGAPIGIDDFRKIRSIGAYYVDKTGLIIDIISRPTIEVFLFTRPRRFGKSLNLSMLDAFFGMDYDSRAMFDGLNVMSDKESAKHINSHPVIHISLKQLRTYSFETFLLSFKQMIRSLCVRYTYLLNWDTEINTKQIFIDMNDGRFDDIDLTMSLKILTEALFRFHGTKAIVLIDEYDHVSNSSYGSDIHDDIIDFMRDFLSNTLKSNSNLEFGVITGVMQISKENIFSGLNNLYVNNIFNKDFSEEFGFTECEVAQMLAYYDHSEKIDEVKEWYDGYHFGDADIYNPWSILNYIQRGFQTGSYWLNEGNPSIILKSMGMVGTNALRVVTELYNYGSVVRRLNTNLIFSELNSMNGFLTLLTGSGYLKAMQSDDGTYVLSIVNNEVRNGFLEQLVSGYWDYDDVNNISKALLGGSPEDVRNELMNSMGMSLDSKLTRDERYYQAFILGLLNCLKSRLYQIRIQGRQRLCGYRHNT